jgi:gamma-glutamyltranspeptidase
MPSRDPSRDGAIAGEIVADMARSGGLLSAADLAAAGWDGGTDPGRAGMALKV